MGVGVHVCDGVGREGGRRMGQQIDTGTIAMSQVQSLDSHTTLNRAKLMHLCATATPSKAAISSKSCSCAVTQLTELNW